MTRLYLLIITIFVCTVSNAEPIKFETARKLASKAIGKSEVSDVQLGAKACRRMAVSPIEAPAFYMFNSDDGEGFAIVSGDDDFPEIIGYSDKGQLRENGSLPDALLSYLEAYSRYVADVRSGVANPPMREETGNSIANPVAPLCTSTWGQGYPYNDYCPKIGVNTCPVGCVATAMAQIMYYHKHPERAKGRVVYNTENQKIGSSGYISENLNTDEHIYQWDLMRDNATLMVGAANAASRNAVAQLSYDCGVASKTMYDITGSASFESDAIYAFCTNFNYSRSTTQLVLRECVATQKEWNDLVIKELNERRPIFFCGSSTKGEGTDATGHAFVIDGYDNTGNVHVNWGWDGVADGFYNIITLDMGEYAFSETQCMIIGIKKNLAGETYPQNRLLVFLRPMEILAPKAELDEGFGVKLKNFYNYNSKMKMWHIAVGLFDKHGRFIGNIATDYELNNLDSWYGFTEYPLTCSIPSKFDNGTEVSDGDYVLRIIINEDGFNREDGSKDWILPYHVGGDIANWHPVMVKDGVAYMGQVSTAIDRLKDNSEVVSRKYFETNGRSLTAPVKGSVVIEQQVLSNGTVRSIKRKY